MKNDWWSTVDEWNKTLLKILLWQTTRRRSSSSKTSLDHGPPTVSYHCDHPSDHEWNFRESHGCWAYLGIKAMVTGQSHGLKPGSHGYPWSITWFSAFPPSNHGDTDPQQVATSRAAGGSRVWTADLRWRSSLESLGQRQGGRGAEDTTINQWSQKIP